MPDQLLDTTDLEQLIKDARYARMKFVRENLKFFAYGSGLLGIVCAFAITVLAVGSANRDQQASTTLPDKAQITDATKAHK